MSKGPKVDDICIYIKRDEGGSPAFERGAYFILFIARLPLLLRPEGVRCISSRARCLQARQAPAGVPVTPKRSSREEIAPPSPLSGASKKPLHFFCLCFPSYSAVSSAPLKGEIDARESKRNPDTASGSLARRLLRLPGPVSERRKRKNVNAI